MASKREGGEKQWRAGLSDVKANRHAPWLSARCVYPPLTTRRFLPAWTSWLSPCTVSCLSLWRSLCDLCFKFSSFAFFLLWTIRGPQSGFLSHLQQVNTADTLWRTPIAGAVPKSQKGISGIYQKMIAGIESIINNLLLYNVPKRSRVIMTSLL